MKRMCFLLMFFISGIGVTFSQNIQDTIMHSNKKVIKLFINKGENDWTISPELDPDIFRLYSTTDKSYDLKFISDTDSLSFTVEVNKPISFSIIYQGDTARSIIDFTNYIPNTLSDQEKIKALSLFWSEVKYNFAYIDKLTFDLDSLYLAYIPKVLKTKNDYEFYNILKLFACNFKDAHTQIIFNNVSEYTDFIPLEVRCFNNELRVINVREDLASMVPLGSRIVEINKLPYQEYLREKVYPFVESDFGPTLQRLSVSKLFSYGLDTITITYQTPDEKIKTCTLPRDGKMIPVKSVGYTPKYPSKPVDISWKDDIAVLSFNTFNDRQGTLISFFESIKDTLYHASAIILDLRSNGGGSTNVAHHLLQYMIKDPYYLTYAWQTRINEGVKKANGNYIKSNEAYYEERAYRTVKADTVFIEDHIKRFNVPMVVLFSNSTASAAEDLLIMLNEREDRPVFIGEPSFGSTGSPLVIRGFPKNGMARICARRVLFPYSMSPFNRGIMPDLLVDYTYDEFMSGLDKEIDIAVDVLRKQIKRKKN